MTKLKINDLQTLKPSGIKETKITITRKDSKFLITPKDVKQMVDETFQKVSKMHNDFKIFIRIWNPTRAFTFNVDSLGNIEQFNEFENYFEGTVKEIQKLVKSGRVEIFVHLYPKAK